MEKFYYDYDFATDFGIYDYKKAMISDLACYCKENGFDHYLTEDDLDELEDDVFSSDDVTGNASGSYFCSRYKAGRALVGNFYLLREAMTEFDIEHLPQEEEADVIVRCYLLQKVMCDFEKVWNEEFKD